MQIYRSWRNPRPLGFFDHLLIATLVSKIIPFNSRAACYQPQHFPWKKTEFMLYQLSFSDFNKRFSSISDIEMNRSFQQFPTWILSTSKVNCCLFTCFPLLCGIFFLFLLYFAIYIGVSVFFIFRVLILLSKLFVKYVWKIAFLFSI